MKIIWEKRFFFRGSKIENELSMFLCGEEKNEKANNNRNLIAFRIFVFVMLAKFQFK
jgi:hypothetical protein